MNYEENIIKLSKQIEEVERRIKDLQKQRREEKREEARKNRKKRGRKPLDNELIERARKMAETKTLRDTAISLGIALSSLYNKDISRKAINAENVKRMLREREENLQED